MNIAIVHNAIAENEADASTLDVVAQTRFVEESLRAVGHQPRAFPFSRDLSASIAPILAWRPDRIFNLVESVDGHARLHPSAAAVFELLGIPHTGASAAALDRATDKHCAKALLRAEGIATPDWRLCRLPGDESWRDLPGPWILKPALEDASLGIDEDSVVRDAAAMPARLESLLRQFPGQPALIEQFLEGREFNVSLIADGSAPRVLPVAEMAFRDYPAGKERVCGFRAKWDPQAFEYTHTVRVFDFPPQDAALIAEIENMALRCWQAFDLRGYARVDIRADSRGAPAVIEVNTNPCISPDAGFCAAAQRGGLAPAEIVQHILEDAVWLPT